MTGDGWSARAARRVATILAATRPTARTDVDGYPRLGAGLLHALGLATALWLPASYAIAAQTASLVIGFPVLAVVLLTLTAAWVGAIVSVVRPLPGAAEILARIGIAFVAAFLVRMSVPTPGAALTAWRAGEARLFSGIVVLAFLLLVAAAASGHALATFVSWLATRAPTRQAAQQRARRGLASWWLAMLVVGTLHAATAGAPIGGVLVVLGGLGGLALLADLRLRTPPPPGAADAIVSAASARTGWGVVLAATVAALVVGVLVLPLVPFRALGSLITPAWLDWLHTEDVGQSFLRNWLALQREPGGTANDAGASVTIRLIDVPLHLQIVSLLILLLLMRILKPHGIRLLHRVRRLFRRGRAQGTMGHASVATPTDHLDEHLLARSALDPLRSLLRRVRGRPNEPRAAVLYDYVHVERLLARDAQERAGHETPHEHAVRVHVSAEHEALADLAAEARFAREAPSPAAVQRSLELRRAIEQALRERS